MIWIRWPPTIFRLWYMYECLLGSQYTSAGFTFSAFFLLIIMAQYTFVFSGSKIGALVWDVGYGRSWWWRHHNNLNDVVLESLLFALDMFALVIYRNNFENVVLLSFLMQFLYADIIWSPGVFEVFIFKFINSDNSDMLKSNFIHQYIATICQLFLALQNCPET